MQWFCSYTQQVCLHTKQHTHTATVCVCERARVLTDTTTVSSPLNFGMFLSPRFRSASFSGLKRHITFTPHTPPSAASITDKKHRHARGNTHKPGGSALVRVHTVRSEAAISGYCFSIRRLKAPPLTGPPWTTEPQRTMGHEVLLHIQREHDLVRVKANGSYLTHDVLGSLRLHRLFP